MNTQFTHLHLHTAYSLSSSTVDIDKLIKLAKKNKCRIYEVGISYYGRTYEEGKKINWKDGLSAFWCIIRYNLF